MDRVTWKTVVIVGCAIAAVVATLLVGPLVGLSEETIRSAISAEGIIGTVLAGLARQMFRTPPRLPRRDSGSLPPLAMLLAVLASSAAVTSGCSSGALGVHARAATVTIAATQTAGSMVDAARDAELDAVEAQHPVRGAEREAALDATALRWRPAGSALDALREALGTWVDAIDLARAADAGDDLLVHLVSIAARAVLLYDRLGRVASDLGAEGVPPLPGFVRALAESVGGR